jgi:hypothetical protein
MAWIAAALMLAVSLSGAARADNEIDACALTPLANVVPLVVQQSGYDLRAKSEHPVPGKSICRWEAFQQGLTADAPPAYTLVATLYHFANAQRATASFDKTWQGMIGRAWCTPRIPPTNRRARRGTGLRFDTARMS